MALAETKTIPEKTCFPLKKQNPYLPSFHDCLPYLGTALNSHHMLNWITHIIVHLFELNDLNNTKVILTSS